MPKAPPTTLTDEILAAAALIKRGPGNWFDQLPADVRDEIASLRELVASGEIAATRTGVAKSIQASLARRGLCSVKWQEISKWLNEKRR